MLGVATQSVRFSEKTAGGFVIMVINFSCGKGKKTGKSSCGGHLLFSGISRNAPVSSSSGSYKFPLLSCSPSKASKRALKFPAPNP